MKKLKSCESCGHNKGSGCGYLCDPEKHEFWIEREENNKMKELETRIAELEECLETFVEDDKGVQTVLLAGDNYDRCDRCRGVYHKDGLTGKKFVDGDDYEVRLYCEHCE